MPKYIFPKQPKCEECILSELDQTKRYYIQEKANGHRLIIKNGLAYQRSWKKNVWPTLPLNIQRKFEQINEWVDGELVAYKVATDGPRTRIYLPASEVPKVWARYRTGILENSFLQFLAFNLPDYMIDGRPATFPEVALQLGEYDFDMPRLLAPPDDGGVWHPADYALYTPYTPAQIAEAWSFYSHNQNYLDFREGLILRPENQEDNWYKLKLEQNTDVLIVGFNPGKGKYHATTGSIMGYSLDGKQRIVRASGMDDEQRKALGQDDIGKVIEVKFNGYGARGKLTHPRFVRFREYDELSDETRAQMVIVQQLLKDGLLVDKAGIA